jgi:5-methyltetrahydropteroyltriglutamate--homocysteine methyltransferase
LEEVKLQATVIGNYPKIGPKTSAPSLRKAITRYQLKEITEDELRQVENEVTFEVLREQEDMGLDIITDGHIRWDDPQTYFASKIQGFQINGLIRYFDTNTYYRQPVALDKLEWIDPISVKDYQFAKTSSNLPVKVVITGPFTLANLCQSRYYKDLASMAKDLAIALNKEAIALAEAGVPIIQFDEPAILHHKDQLSLFLDLMNGLLEGVNTRKALCTYFGDLSGIEEEIFDLPFDIFGLDLVTNGFKIDCLKKFPDAKSIGLGIIDARNVKLESMDEILSVISEACQWVDPEKIQVSPNCGLEFLPRTNARNKLTRMVQAVSSAKETIL